MLSMDQRFLRACKVFALMGGALSGLYAVVELPLKLPQFSLFRNWVACGFCDPGSQRPLTEAAVVVEVVQPPQQPEPGVTRFDGIYRGEMTLLTPPPHRCGAATQPREMQVLGGSLRFPFHIVQNRGAIGEVRSNGSVIAKVEGDRFGAIEGKIADNIFIGRYVSAYCNYDLRFSRIRA